MTGDCVVHRTIWLSSERTAMAEPPRVRAVSAGAWGTKPEETGLIRGIRLCGRA